MRRFAYLGLLIMGGLLAVNGDASAAAAAKTTKGKSEAAPAASKAGAGEDVAVLKTSMGTIVFRFFEKDAPKHVANFKKLASSGFYDGTTFHRVIPGFMIQGGDPNSTDADRSNDGLGGSGTNVPAEFNANKHLRGTVSMARAQDPNSASSQFFICVKPTPFLDGQYSVFGQVLEGMDVVDKIVAVPRDARDNPLDKVVMEKVTIEKRKI
jgi:cyclophilin family peptidyl-prolyl cis-trans isomerase